MSQVGDHLQETGAAARAPIMELRGIRKSFGPVQALKGVDLVIAPGEIHAVVGENGAGKSTLIGIASGALVADAGTIIYAGNPVTAPQPRLLRESGISVSHQHPSLRARPDRAREPAAGGARPRWARSWSWRWRGRRQRRRRRCRRGRTHNRRIAAAPHWTPLDHRVAELSLPQKHVVEIARALATRPRVIFFDEPTEPFQQADMKKLFDLIRALRDEGVAIVYVSHRLHEVAELADRISVMRDGEIIDSRPAGEITTAEVITLIAGRPRADLPAEIGGGRRGGP